MGKALSRRRGRDVCKPEEPKWEKTEERRHNCIHRQAGNELDLLKKFHAKLRRGFLAKRDIGLLKTTVEDKK